MAAASVARPGAARQRVTTASPLSWPLPRSRASLREALRRTVDVERVDEPHRACAVRARATSPRLRDTLARLPDVVAAVSGVRGRGGGRTQGRALAIDPAWADAARARHRAGARRAWCATAA